MNVIKSRGRWIVALLVVSMLTVAGVVVADGRAHAAAPSPKSLDQKQFFNGEVVIEAGQTINDDVVVMNGNATVESGGAIHGSLVVYAGDILVEEGARVDGDIAAFSGEVQIYGVVDGDIASWSGDILLADSAVVEGDVSVLSGKIERASGASVDGSIVRGPSFELPSMNFDFSQMAPFAGPAPELDVQPQRAAPSLLRQLGLFILRLLRAMGVTVLLIIVGALLTQARPAYVAGLVETIRSKAAQTFVIGLFANLGLLLIAMVLTVLVITICLVPLPVFLLIGLNLAGWTATSQIVGAKVGRRLEAELSASIQVVLGALIFGVALGPLWAFGGCFRFIASLALLGISSFGVGAVLWPWLNRTDSSDVTTDVAKPSPPALPLPSSVTPSTPPPSTPPPSTPPTVAGTPSGGDDLTRINGIGAVFHERLAAAGITTFAQLANLSPEAVAAIIEWPIERVLRNELIEQAARLSAE